ncbi:MAG TPA: primosomal protein N' [Dehalococcoidia bacterium]|nr:primosomal protein N' [Dehalococcoidia bacterium]
MFAEVAVNAAQPIRQTFTYRIPDSLAHVRTGHAVYVPFGARTLQGIVMAVTETPAFADARDIEGIIDEEPLVSPQRLAVAQWLSEHYLAPLFDCVTLMLPAGFKRKPLTFLRAAFWAPDSMPGDLSEAERAVLDAIAERGEIDAEEGKRAVKGGVRAVASLVKRGLVARTYRLARPSVAEKHVPHLRLLIGDEEARSQARALGESGRKPDQRRAVVLEALTDEGPMPLSRARTLGLTPAMLRDLQAEGIAAVEDVQVLRDPLAGREYARRAPPRLTADQQRATDAICAALGVRTGALTHDDAGLDPGARTFLLHGVTGSGKTEVYLAALDRAVALGKRAIVLVPEIALTPQTLRRFAERFPGRVAVMHSELSLGEHFDIWHAVRAGRYDVVIGPRGALFAPQPDLGLVIIDEEHEWTYKQQEGSPRYHARLAAEHLCRAAGAALVLGSATPDVESRFRAEEGSTTLLELPERLVREDDGRVHPAPLPEVDVIDLREELKAGNRSIFSRELAAAIRRALDADEQVMLFLNRRGTASFLQCRDCGHVPECRSCASALTYHAPQQKLVCHYCGRTYPMPPRCPNCGGNRLRQVGLGTERVEEAVREEFRGARTVRWDRDVTRGRDAHEAILARFLAHEADILIGTQMIAKGLDIPLVTLVGVVSADIALHFPDFRAGERTFQLLEQVAGRAGRGPKGGRVIIQTYTPDHYAIVATADHNYHSLYAHEIEFRRRMGYPPFGRLVRMTFAHTGFEYAQRQAAIMTRRLREEQERLGLPNLDVLGPAPAFVPRVRGRWRWNVILRGGDPAALIRDLPLPRGWTVDVDPLSVL